MGLYGWSMGFHSNSWEFQGVNSGLTTPRIALPLSHQDFAVRPFSVYLFARCSKIPLHNNRRPWPIAGEFAAIPRKGQTACKPGSVPPCSGDGHSSGTSVAGRLARPTRAAARKTRLGDCSPDRSYLVLLPVGFTVPPPLPGTRCALTAPFHPCRAGKSLCRRGGLLSVALSLGSPPPGVTRHRVSVEPGLSSPCASAKGSHPAVWQALRMLQRRQRQCGTIWATRAVSRRRVSPSGLPAKSDGRKCR